MQMRGIHPEAVVFKLSGKSIKKPRLVLEFNSDILVLRGRSPTTNSVATGLAQIADVIGALKCRHIVGYI
jgi:hypothetical protein